MPRHVDAEQRRQDVARAVWRVVLRGGLATASVRAIAAESGFSVGTLRHYFKTQADLQLYALELVNLRAVQRLSAVNPDSPVRERIESMMWALLPVDTNQREEQQVWLSFQVESRTNSEFRHVIAEEEDYAQRLTSSALHALREHGLAPAELDTDTATTELTALLEGLTVKGALYPDTWPPERIKTTVRNWFDALAARAGARADTPENPQPDESPG